MKYLHQKYCSNYVDIPSSRSRILASWEEMKNISALYKRNNKFIKKWLSSFDIVYCLVPLVILYRLLFKQFLTEDGWPLLLITCDPKISFSFNLKFCSCIADDRNQKNVNQVHLFLLVSVNWITSMQFDFHMLMNLLLSVSSNYVLEN